VTSFLFVLSGIAWTDDYYVDTGCTYNGNGTTETCAATGGGSGPWNSLSSASFLCGDTINIRGVHDAHGDSHVAGTNDGRHHADWYRLRDKACNPSGPLIIQSYGWTEPGTGEGVFIDGTVSPGGTASCAGSNCGWTQCVWGGTSCNSPCAGVGDGGQAACEDTWHVTGAFPAAASIGAQKPNGSVTYAVGSLAELTNDHGSGATPYNDQVCSWATWKHCDTNADCLDVDGTCTGSSAEIDSYRDPVTPRLFVRWGTGTNAPGGISNPKPFLIANNNGFGFFIDGTSSHIIIRGLNFRAHSGSSIVARSNTASLTVSDITVDDIHSYYHDDAETDSDYGFNVLYASGITFRNSTVAYTSSEAIHTQPRDGNAATSLAFGNLWVHHIGDERVLGPQTSGTPNCMILGSFSGSSSSGNYSGSVISNLLCENTFRNQNVGLGGDAAGIRFENASHHWIVRDSIFRNVDAECMLGDNNTGSTGENQIYNNLFVNCGKNPTNGGTRQAIHLDANGSNPNSGWSIYNNTFVEPNAPHIGAAASPNITDNKIRNNILHTAGSQTVVLWLAEASSNKFEHNLVTTSSSPAITWRNADYGCYELSTAGTGNIDGCPSPAFVNSGASDYHIQASSPAKDAGTTTGMPVDRTTDVYNSLASLHGMPSYDDGDVIQGGAWDMGIDEYVASGGGGGGGPHHKGAALAAHDRARHATSAILAIAPVSPICRVP
jgi:hypothetical protein